MSEWAVWVQPAMTLVFGVVGVLTGVKVSLALMRKDIEHIKEKLNSLDAMVERAAVERGRIYERIDGLGERVARLEGMAGK